MFIFLLLLFVVKGTEIISTFPHLISNAGTIVQKTRFTIRCDSEVPYTFTIEREGLSTPDTVTVECLAPEIKYNAQQRSVVPLGQNLIRIPIVLSADIMYNKTTAQAAYIDRLVRESLNNANLPPLPSQNILSLRKLLQLKPNHLIQLLQDDSFHPNDFRKLLQDDSGDPNAPPPLPPFDPKGAPPLVPPKDSPDLDALDKEKDMVVPDYDSIVSIQQIQKIELLEQATTGLVQSIGTGLLVSGLGTGFGGLNGVAILSGVLSQGLNLALSASGGDPLQLVVKDMKILFTDVANIVTQIDRMFKEQIQVDQLFTAQFDDVYGTEEKISLRQDIDEEQLFVLRNRTNLIINYINSTVTSMNKRFNDTQTKIDILSGEETNVTRIIKLLSQQSDARFKQLLHTINILQQQITANSDATESIRQNRQLIRIAAQSFHDSLQTMIDHSELGPGLPFMNDIGSAPLSASQRAQRRSVSGAIVMASVEIQGTLADPSIVGTAHSAVQIQVQILCDPTYIANFSLDSIGFDFIVQAIGPHTDQQLSCHDPWICNCIFRVNYTKFAMANINNVYPFDSMFSAGIPMWEDKSTVQITSQHCIPEPVTCTPSNIQFFDSLNGLSEFLAGPLVCSLNWYTQRIRIADARIGYFLSVSTNPNDYIGGKAEMCDVDYTMSASNRTTIGFALFTYLRKEFDMYWGSIRTTVDRSLYGSLGQVAIRDIIGSRLPSLVHAYRTLVIEYAALLSRQEANIPRLLPLFNLAKEDTVFKVKLTVNTQDPILFDLDTRAQSMPIGGSHTGNFSLASNRQLSSIRGIEQLEESMKWLGPEIVYTQDSRTHEPFAPFDPTVLVDFAKHELCDGTADQRANCMNYLELRRADLSVGYPFGEGMPFNLSTWSVSEGNPIFEPRYVNSPSGRLILMNPNNRKCLFQQRDPVTMELTPSGPFRTMCNIRKDFDVPLSFDIGQVSFTAREWTYDFEFDWSGTKVEELSITRCPDSAEVIANGTKILIRSSSPISFAYSICTATNDCTTTGTTFYLNGADSITIGVLNVEYFFQAWPSSDPVPTPSNRCYSQTNGLGLPIFIDRNYTFVSGLPNNVEASVLQILTPTQIQMTSMFTLMLQLHQATVLMITDIDGDALPAMLTQITDNANAALAGIPSLSDDPTFDNATARFIKSLIDNDNIFFDLVNKSNAVRDQILQGILQGRQLNNLTKSIIKQLVNDSDVLDSLINKFITDLNDVGSPASLNLLDLFKKLIEGIINAAGGLAKGLFGLFGDLLNIGAKALSIIKDVIIFIILGCLICGCYVFYTKIKPMLKYTETGNYQKLPQSNQ